MKSQGGLEEKKCAALQIIMSLSQLSLGSSR